MQCVDLGISSDQLPSVIERTALILKRLEVFADGLPRAGFGLTEQGKSLAAKVDIDQFDLFELGE